MSKVDRKGARETLDEVEARLMSRLDENGHEVPDPTPLTIPSGFRRPETLQEQVARLVRGAMSRRAEEEGFETFEDSEDFDVDEDFDPRTPFEEVFDPLLGRGVTPQEMQEHGDRYRDLYLAAERNRYRQHDLERRAAAVPDDSRKVNPSAFQQERPAKPAPSPVKIEPDNE